MANAKCCDRCGNYYRNDILRMEGVIASVGGVKIVRRDDPNISGELIELCPYCADAFLSFMHMVRGADKKEDNK